MIFKNGRTYDILKWVFSVVLPALSAFYIGFSEAWQGVIPVTYPERVSATIFLIVALADAVLGFSSIKYKNLTEEEKRELESYETEDE